MAKKLPAKSHEQRQLEGRVVVSFDTKQRIGQLIEAQLGHGWELPPKTEAEMRIAADRLIKKGRL